MQANKLNSFLKNIIVFLAIFLIANYLLQQCMGPVEEENINQGNLIFETTKESYSRTKIITVEISNYTESAVIIPNECPAEPFTIQRYEENEWVNKTASPELDCSNATDIEIKPGEEIKIPYTNWNHTLFSEMGRFRIQFTTEINGEEKTITTNEFRVEKEGLFTQLWRGVFYRPIYNALIYIVSTLPGHNLGLAIILLTLIIRTILLIPSQKAMESQRKMQEIQPRLEKIKQKYKGDQQRIATETMAVWKDANVKPMGSCLPILLQFPFLIAIFYVIRDGLNPDNIHLFYSEYENFALHDINVNFFNLLDLTKNNLYVLPLIIGGLQFLQMKLSFAKKAKKDEKKGKNEMAMAQNMMLYIMPVMIAVFTASLPSGVGIYWGTSTIYGIGQQLFINKSKPSPEPKVRVVSTKKKQG